MRELYSNWSLTTSQSLAGVRKMGGFTWSGFNCMLDTDTGYSRPPGLAPDRLNGLALRELSSRELVMTITEWLHICK
jgi:hypothetical protein